jgi:hypothetical protein
VADYFDRTQRQTARMAVAVGSANVDNVNLTLAPVPALQGRVRAAAGDTVKLDSLRLSLTGTDDMGGMMRGPGGFGGGGAVGADGAFTLANLTPQIYTLTLNGLPETHYLDSIKLGEVDLTNGPLDLSGGVAGALTITIAAGSGTLQGTVRQEQQPAEGATAVLVPEEARRPVGYFYKIATTDQNGQFTMKGIAPGEYKLFAWDEVESDRYRAPAFLKKFESRGTTVSIMKNGSSSAQIPLLSAAQAEQ